MTSAGPGLQAALIAFSLRFRGVVIALAALVIAAGAYSLGHATYDVFPEFAPPQAVIHTGAPGLSPDQVEVLVTQPLENALTGAPGLASLRSSSIQGLSIITANFDPASDVLRDRQVHAPERARRHSDIVWTVIPVVVVFLLAARSWLAVVDLPHPAAASAGGPVTQSVAQPIR